MSKLIISQMIVFYSNIYGVDPEVALAVAQVESNLNPSAISPTNDYGLFQLNRRSFPEYSTDELLDPNKNIILGIQYLAKMQKECSHKDDINWLVCYNGGKEFAKKVKHPQLFPYVKKVQLAMDGYQ